MPTKLPIPILLFVLGLLPVPPATSNIQNNARAVSETVIFSLKKYPDSDVNMEPVVMIKNGQYIYPPVDEEGGSKQFTDSYFRINRKYRMVFGGGDAGSVKVTKVLEPGCVGLIAQVDLETNVRVGGQVQALAVTNQTLGAGPSARRAPTDAERTQALDLAKTIYIRRKTPVSLVRKMNTVNLTSIDLERDGKFEMIGSFNIQGANMLAYNLFVFFELTANGKYRVAWNWYQKGNEETYEDRSLVDVIDLDGDGVAEVIAEGTYYESNDYIIYKRQTGTWRQIYKGGGGGC